MRISKLKVVATSVAVHINIVQLKGLQQEGPKSKTFFCIRATFSLQLNAYFMR